MSPPLPLLVELTISAALLVGAAFALVGSWGLASLPDFFTRLHGPSKASTLGVGGVLVASMLWFSLRSGTPSLHELLITLFLFVTAPVSAHMLAKAALHLRLRTGYPLPDEVAATDRGSEPPR
jgi:multicomponent K+:H+ antiporter subunit G